MGQSRLMVLCQQHTHALVTGVAASLGQLVCWTLIGSRACQSSRRGCACYSGRLWSSGAQHHLWHSHLDVYMASLWSPMFLASFSFIFLQISSSYEQLSAFVEGRWVDHFVLITWYWIPQDYLCDASDVRETMRNKDHTYILGVFYMRSSYGDKLVWHRCLYSLSTLHTRWVWIETQGLLQWNTRENPSASIYRANPYLLLKLEAEMSVRWDAEMINITAGMWRLWSISHIQYLSVAHPVMLLLIVWITGFQNNAIGLLNVALSNALWIQDVGSHYEYFAYMDLWMFMINNRSCVALIVLWMSCL